MAVENRVRKTLLENPNADPDLVLDCFRQFLQLHPEHAPTSDELSEFVRME